MKTGGSASARKVLGILFSFDERRHTATVAELAQQAGVPLPTAYRYVGLLKELGLIQESSPSRYSPSARVIPVARAAQVSNPISRLARPIMDRIVAEVNETVLLMQYATDQAVCIQAIECDRPMRYTFQPGHTVPLGRGASGKLVLALLPEQQRESWLAEHDGGGAIREEIARIGAERRAESDGELYSGVWAASVEVVNLGDRPIVLSVAGPASRISEDDRQWVRQTLRQGATDIRNEIARISL